MTYYPGRSSNVLCQVRSGRVGSGTVSRDGEPVSPRAGPAGHGRVAERSIPSFFRITFMLQLISFIITYRRKKIKTLLMDSGLDDRPISVQPMFKLGLSNWN